VGDRGRAKGQHRPSRTRLACCPPCVDDARFWSVSGHRFCSIPAIRPSSGAAAGPTKWEIPATFRLWSALGTPVCEGPTDGVAPAVNVRHVAALGQEPRGLWMERGLSLPITSVDGSPPSVTKSEGFGGGRHYPYRWQLTRRSALDPGSQSRHIRARRAGGCAGAKLHARKI
jgi:hypothetical protein